MVPESSCPLHNGKGCQTSLPSDMYILWQDEAWAGPSFDGNLPGRFLALSFKNMYCNAGSVEATESSNA